MGQPRIKAKKAHRNASLHKGLSKERISPQNLNVATPGFCSEIVTKQHLHKGIKTALKFEHGSCGRSIFVYPFEATLSGSPQDEGEEGCARVSLSSLFNMEHKKCHLSLKGQCYIDHHLWLDPQMGQCLTKAKKLTEMHFYKKDLVRSESALKILIWPLVDSGQKWSQKDLFLGFQSLVGTQLTSVYTLDRGTQLHIVL